MLPSLRLRIPHHVIILWSCQHPTQPPPKRYSPGEIPTCVVGQVGRAETLPRLRRATVPLLDLVPSTQCCTPWSKWDIPPQPHPTSRGLHAAGFADPLGRPLLCPTQRLGCIPALRAHGFVSPILAAFVQLYITQPLCRSPFRSLFLQRAINMDLLMARNFFKTLLSFWHWSSAFARQRATLALDAVGALQVRTVELVENSGVQSIPANVPSRFDRGDEEGERFGQVLRIGFLLSSERMDPGISSRDLWYHVVLH